MLIAGDRDAAGDAVSVRLRSGEDLGGMLVTDFIAKAKAIVDSKSLALQ
jgi:threonyl-tRNA synthetase